MAETGWDGAMAAVDSVIAMPAEGQAAKRTRKYSIELALLKLDEAALAEKKQADEEAASKKDWLTKKVREVRTKARAAIK